jgi:hypothetical protein
VPIAVGDLERASADFTRLGFALKEGRPHPDGIRNRHVKFRDGTEVELITAPAATDELTRYYRERLAQGDGAAFLSLHPVNPQRAFERMAAAGLPVRGGDTYPDFPYTDPLGYIFFASLNHSPTDRPEHFAHRNSAASLVGVWLEGASFAAERRLLKALGLREQGCADGSPAHAACVALSDGARLVLVSNRTVARTRIARLELRADSLDSLLSVLAQGHVSFRRTAPARVSIDGTDITHGVGLDFMGDPEH